MDNKNKTAILFAILSATFYALNLPCSKLLLTYVPKVMMASFLYLGAGLGMLVMEIVKKIIKKQSTEENLTAKDLPYTIAMIILDILAPIFLMIGLTKTTAANVALLNNFEIAATSVIAFLIFKEAITKRLWVAILFVTIASIILSFKDISSFSFSVGSVFVLLACICWGFENNCTKMLSNKNPMFIVMIKGLLSGAGSFVIAKIAGESVPGCKYIVLTLILGFIAYGLSIFFYIYAQRYIGAAKTSTYYAVAPFIGATLSLIIFKEMPGSVFIIALILMVIGTYFAQ